MAAPDTMLKFCTYAGCKKPVPSNHYLCTEHYEDSLAGLIDQ